MSETPAFVTCHSEISTASPAAVVNSSCEAQRNREHTGSTYSPGDARQTRGHRAPPAAPAPTRRGIADRCPRALRPDRWGRSSEAAGGAITGRTHPGGARWDVSGSRSAPGVRSRGTREGRMPSWRCALRLLRAQKRPRGRGPPWLPAQRAVPRSRGREVKGCGAPICPQSSLGAPTEEQKRLPELRISPSTPGSSPSSR